MFQAMVFNTEMLIDYFYINCKFYVYVLDL